MPTDADARHVLVSRIERDIFHRSTDQLTLERNEEILRQVRLLPGVRSAALYIDSDFGRYTNVDGSPRPTEFVRHQDAMVSKDYFAASGYRLHAGRLFNDTDNNVSFRYGNVRPALIVNEAFVRRFAPTFRTVEQAVNLDVDDTTTDGKRITIGRIVGVVNDLNLRQKTAVEPQMFRAIGIVHQIAQLTNSLVIRTTGDPEDLEKGAQNIMRIHNLRLLNPETLEDRVNASVATRQFETNLLTAFAAVALTLAIIGIYGVLSYAVSQRTREIGIRVAMGASRGDVLSDILRDGWRLTLAGMFVGIAGALAFTKMMRSMLTNVEPADPLVLASVCVLVFTIATLAALVPARRATRRRSNECTAL